MRILKLFYVSQKYFSNMLKVDVFTRFSILQILRYVHYMIVIKYNYKSACNRNLVAQVLCLLNLKKDRIIL